MKKTTIVSTEERKTRLSLTLVFSISVFVILVLSVLIASGFMYLFNTLGWISSGELGDAEIDSYILFMIISSGVIGFTLAVLLMKYPLKPVTHLIGQMNRLSKGDFKARIEFPNAIASYPVFKEIEESFNKMATDLEGTELLHSDFINNFSHEFKTPIVSILGFAKLLKHGNITDAEKEEYIEIIEEESLRLSTLANNVMSLNKVQKKNKLTDTARYNLSEQLRASILLLESKWQKKETELSLDFDEYYITANEEMLKEVWINLFDNAIKFAPEGGLVSVSIKSDDKKISVSVTNSGSAISPENISKLFDKFYQEDSSHNTEGNGIGLAIVKKIVELHHGSVAVHSSDDKTTFTVTLPNPQPSQKQNAKKRDKNTE